MIKVGQTGWTKTRAVVGRERQHHAPRRQEHEQRVPHRVTAIVPDHGAAGRIALVADPVLCQNSALLK